MVIYSSAHVSHPEVLLAQSLGINTLSYAEALAEVVNNKYCIAVAGSHGKSTTTAMIGVMLRDSPVGGSTVVGTKVPQLNNSNFYSELDSMNFVIEACEYRRAFLQYHPKISIITNIDLDHLDYYSGIADYISAFQSFVDQTSEYIVVDGKCIHSAELSVANNPYGAKILRVYDDYYLDADEQRQDFPWISGKTKSLALQVPGDHIEFDARLAFVTGKLLGLEDDFIIDRLNSYRGSWRRSEIIRTTEHGNILMSDYGHHPNEIAPTLQALKGKYADRKLFVVFQPHQHSRTRELLEGFTTCFDAADGLVIPNIYFSRDKEEDVAWMTTERLVERLAHNYPFVRNGNGLENTLELIRQYDRENPSSSVILLLGAGDLDNLRSDIG